LPKAIAKAPAGKVDVNEDVSVDIPDDWKTLHYMKQIQLAKQINPDIVETPEKKLSVVAVETIEAELERRANPNPDPGALSTTTAPTTE
jgi:hypothetical protein